MEKLELNGKLAIVHPQTFKKPVMVKLKQRKNRLTGIVQNNAAAVEPDVLDLNEDELVCVFPSEYPPAGKVYSCKVEPFVKAMKANKWGNIYYYRHLTDAEQSNFNRALDYSYRKFIKPNKISHVLPINLEIRPNTGALKGYYCKKNKVSEHAICLCPISFVGSGNSKELQWLVNHELGHPLWTIYLSDEYKEKWVRLYHDFCVIDELTTDDLKAAHALFKESGELPSEHRKGLEDKPKVIFNAIFKYIKEKHKLKIIHLDLMVGQETSNLSEFWPKNRLHLSEMKVPVSKYAGKAPVEMWCESMAAYSTKAELPVKIKNLVIKSIKSLRAK